ncbi:MAG: IS200/IS605 family transposase [Armatimonas sp.]
MRRSKIIVPVHFVWRTKRQEAWITEDIEERLHRVIATEAGTLGAKVLAIGGTENHVHMAVLFPATISIGEFAKHIKGASSRLATTELLNRSVYWQEGYGAFAFQVGLTDRVVTYIQHQKEHHHTGVGL